MSPMSRSILIAAVRCSVLLLTLCLAAPRLHAGGPVDLDELRKRAQAAKQEEQVNLYNDLARREIELADNLMNGGKPGEGMAYLEESVNDAIHAGDAAVQCHRRQKETEIAVRKMIKEMKDLQRIVSLDDSQIISQGVNQLEKVRTQLLASMFDKQEKK